MKTESGMNTESGKKMLTTFASGESWLRSATVELRPYFESCGFPVPGTYSLRDRLSPHGSGAARALANAGIVRRPKTATLKSSFARISQIRSRFSASSSSELVHVVLPVDAGHGKLYKEAAIKIGLEGKMRHALPNRLLRPRLVEVLAEGLGALPHARLNIERGRDNRPADQPKKQKARLLKAQCEGEGCGYTLRITAKWVDDIGAPLCPRHGAMGVDRPEAAEEQSV